MRINRSYTTASSQYTHPLLRNPLSTLYPTPPQSPTTPKTMVLSSSLPSDHSKPCTLCSTPRDVLIRCQIDSTSKWHFVCPGKCWTSVSGGVIDGDKSAYPNYRYGGMWKNKVAAVSAKKPKRGKNKGKGRGEIRDWKGRLEEEGGGKGKDEEEEGKGVRYTVNDKVRWEGKVWICRKSHFSREDETPGKAIGLWKEDDSVQSGTEEEEAGSG